MKKIILLATLFFLVFANTAFAYILNTTDTRIATNKVKVLNKRIQNGTPYSTIYKQQLNIQNKIKENRDSKNIKSVTYKNLDKKYSISKFILENLIDYNAVKQNITTNVPIQAEEKIVVNNQPCDYGWYYNGLTMSCQPNNLTRSCSITNGTGKQVWNGNSWNACTAITCNSGYSVSNGSCLEINSTQQTNTTNNQPTCSSNQHIENNTCVSNTKSCTVSNGVGQQTWNGNSWGNCVDSSFTCNESTHRYWNSTNIYTTAIYNAELRLQEAQSLLKMREEIFARVLNIAATNVGGGQLPEWEFYARINPANPIYNSYVVDINNAKALISQSYTNLNNAIINSSRALEKETDKTKFECISNTKSCTVSNGVGQQSWTSNAWGSCNITKCEYGFVLDNNSCKDTRPYIKSFEDNLGNKFINNLNSRNTRFYPNYTDTYEAIGTIKIGDTLKIKISSIHPLNGSMLCYSTFRYEQGSALNGVSGGYSRRSLSECSSSLEINEPIGVGKYIIFSFNIKTGTLTNLSQMNYFGSGDDNITVAYDIIQ